MNKRQIAEEELKRALLMMKYDSRKTLTENIETQENMKGEVISEIDWGQVSNYAAAGAVGGAIATPMFLGAGSLVGGAAGAIGNIISQSIYGTPSRDGVEKILEACKNKNEVGKPTMNSAELKQIADNINAAVETYMGTEEEDIKTNLASLKTIPDLCAMAEIYNTRHGETLYDALDGDFDDPTDWKNYVYLPILDVYDNTPKKEEVQGSPEVKDGKKTEDNKKTVYTGGGSYKACTGTYTQGCKSQTIKKVQGCLGLVDDGKFGPKTQKALAAKGFASGFTDADVDKICNKVQASPEPTVELPTPENNIDSLN